ncbi:cation transporter [Halobacteriales archaeon QS_1_68_20]|nr:MAG: cation transporter [Halobacteriales archaeon QS_1_68_20]
MAGQSTSVVLAALFANGAIAVLKFVGYLLTGSPAMLSETYHSVSDTGNQIFLLFGIFYGRRERDRQHPFGYGKAQFFYAFLVSVMLFGIAGWESIKNGYEAIVHGEVHLLHGQVTLLGETFPAVWVNYGVLLGGIAFESYAFLKAYKATKAEIRERDWSGFVEAFRKTSDVTTLTALIEDTVALAGLVLALVGIYLTQVTGDPVYDAASALLIGVLLMGFALALAWENKRLLIGESVPESAERDLRTIVEEFDGVAHVDGLRTVYFGPNAVLVTGDVSFDPDLDTAEIDDRISAIEDAIMEAESDVQKVYIEPEV